MVHICFMLNTDETPQTYKCDFCVIISVKTKSYDFIDIFD